MKTLSQRILLEENERIIAIVRKHWFILLAKTILPLVLMFLPFFVYVLAQDNQIIQGVFSALERGASVALFLSALWVLIMWIAIFTAWTDYYLDIWTVTNLRIIAIDQRGLFSRSIASFRYERLQDVNIEINGIIATFLDFGRLEAQTAGHGVSEFIFNGAPQPRETKARILDAANARSANPYRANTPNDDGV